MSQHLRVRMLCEGAVFVALAEILGFLKIGHLPNGGSVSLLMLPMIVFALRWGLGSGLLAGFALGVLDFLVGGGIAIGWQSILGDYVIALTALGLAGLGRGRGLPGLAVGTVLGCLGRFLSIWVTGATLWGEYMPEEFLGLPMTNEWVYSLLYNGIPIGASSAATLAVVLALAATPARRYLLGHDIR
ncbi:MAG: proton-coupled thiamine transporter YuaJ [Oscillospiraceae bacterium]|nr:proton-coupled thiamine transporter YuaJ [Oscillospiraceae bacterium]